ncbi:Uncharacterised protein [uncultured archaeon]|nr:Uncharacterised protein [uncultured archaeon]
MKTEISVKENDNARRLANIFSILSIVLASILVISVSSVLSAAAPNVGPISVEQTQDGSNTSSNITVKAIINASAGTNVTSCSVQTTTGGLWFNTSIWNPNTSTCVANISGLSANATYQFNIKAIDNAGNESVGSPVIKVIGSAANITVSNASSNITSNVSSISNITANITNITSNITSNITQISNMSNITNITAPMSFTTSPDNVTAGQNQTTVDFPVCWNGSDIGGPGIANFSLFVKNNTLSWMPWTSHENATSFGCANFTGSTRDTFCFKSRATDLNGTIEPDKDVGNTGVSCTNVKAFSSNITTNGTNVTGNITNVTGNISGLSTFNISLSSGWNLISLPIVPVDKSITSVLKDIKSNVRSVWAYDPLMANSTGGWLSFAPDAPSNLNTMDAGFGYWIDMANASTLTIFGNFMSPATTPPQRTLVPGWNLVGEYGTDAKRASCSLYSLVNTNSGIPRWTSLWSYSGNFTPLTGNSTMSPGKGFWAALNSEQASYMYVIGDCPSSP